MVSVKTAMCGTRTRSMVTTSDLLDRSPRTLRVLMDRAVAGSSAAAAPIHVLSTPAGALVGEWCGECGRSGEPGRLGIDLGEGD